MTTVTFPTRLGGTGLTVSDNQMFNGGHRQFFFPCLDNMVRMADYVYQYANKIDNAAADAQKAQDAKTYVEAVADSYQVNIKDSYKESTSLKLDFCNGFYFSDNGKINSSSEISSIFNYSRSSLKYSFSPSMSFIENTSNTLARQWENNKFKGGLIEGASTNINLWSEDFTRSAWGKVRGEVSPQPNQTYRFSSNATDAYLVQTVLGSSGIYTSWFVVKPEINQGTLIIARNNSNGWATAPRVDFNLGNQTIIRDDTNGGFIRKLGNNFLLVGVSAEIVGNSVDTSVRLNIPAGHNYVDVKYSQLEKSVVPTSYIKTQSASVMRNKDVLTKQLSSDFNPLEFTALVRAYKNAGQSKIFPILKFWNSDQVFQGIGIQIENDSIRLVVRSNNSNDSVTLPLPGNELLNISFSFNRNRNRCCLFVNGRSAEMSLSNNHNYPAVWNMYVCPEGHLSGGSADVNPFSSIFESIEVVPFEMNKNILEEITNV